MKTLNSFPVVKKSVVVLFTVILLSSTAFAGGITKMKPISADFVVSGSLDLSLLSEAEEELVLEDWMLSADSFFVEDYEEEKLVMESWMLDVDSFFEESEEELALEPWMLDVNTFFVKVQDDYQEPKLVLEPWMLDVNSFFKSEGCKKSNYALK